MENSEKTREQLISELTDLQKRVSELEELEKEALQKKKNLQNREQIFQMISELVSDYIYLLRVKPNGWLERVWVTDAVTQITRYTLDELDNLDGWVNLVHPEDREIVIKHRQAFFAGKEDVSEYRIITKDGEVRWLCDYSRPIWDEEEDRVVQVIGAAQDITERKRAEEKLGQYRDQLEELAEERTQELKEVNLQLQKEIGEHRLARERLVLLEKAIETVDIGITVTDKHRKIIFTNQAEAEMHGYLDVDELLAQDVRIFSPDELVEERKFREMRKRLKRESLNKRKDGTVFPVNLTYNIVNDENGAPNCMIAICEDITERKESESKMQESEERYRSLYENTVLGFYRTTPDGKILMANPAFIRMLGYDSMEDLEGFNLERDLKGQPGYSRKEFKELISNLGEIKGYERSWSKKDGSQIFIRENSKSVRDEEGNVKYYEGTVEDITEKKKMEEKLRKAYDEMEQRVRERTEELNKANAELAQAAQIKDEFLSAMSHELRTPLTSILIISEALQFGVYGELGERQLKALKTIDESGHSLLELINSLLDFSEIDFGEVELHFLPVSVKAICNGSLRLIRQIAEKKNLEIAMEIDTKIPTIQADERHLKQVLVNLLSNAVKFTEEGGKIGLKAETDLEQEIIKFAVWDNGIGISEGDKEKLFKPFVQLDSSLSRKYGGTGIGLSLVYEIVKLHGGKVTIESEIGKGSSFTVELPLKKAVEKSVKPAIEEAMIIEPEGKIGAKQPLILVAEDNETNAMALTSFLTKVNYRVVLAKNGREAVERARKEKPDIILMDIQMPIMDGIEAVRCIRNDERISAIPIIALTGLGIENDRERILREGADEYISKPFRLDKLTETIEKFLK